MNVQILESEQEPNTYHIVDDMTGEVFYENLVAVQVLSVCRQLGYTITNKTALIDISERGQMLGIALVCLLVLAVFAIGILGLLSGNTSVLDLYNWIGQLFQSIA